MFYYDEFHGKMVIVMTAIMSDNLKLPAYDDFTSEVFRHLDNQIHGHICVMLNDSVAG